MEAEKSKRYCTDTFLTEFFVKDGLKFLASDAGAIISQSEALTSRKADYVNFVLAWSERCS